MINPMIDREGDSSIFDWEYNPSFENKAFCLQRPLQTKANFVGEDLDLK